MDIKDTVKQLRQDSKDYFLLHDMPLPISAEKMFNIMCKPENWQVVNFPIIKKVEVIESKDNSVSFYLYEKLLGKYYKSKIILTYNINDLRIEYCHEKPTFPFVSKMASVWYFVNEDAYISHFYIIRNFTVKNVFIKFFFLFIKKIIDKHVADYHKQLIAVTKNLSLSNAK
ncbi:MAG: hypothetical protein LBG45_10680 [Dysgonamonadaceae bacterium]|nr:hypothetical protein [Dysgonamonadaceae bacterium]